MAISAGGIGVAAGEELFVSKPLTPPGEYTSHIEGPAVNAAGDLFVAGIKMPGAGDDGGAIGRVKSGATTSELFAILPKMPNQNGVQGIGNGIRFDGQGRMYVADFKNHLIHVFEPGPTTVRSDYFVARPNSHGRPVFSQPNDLAIARDGTLYASDPKGGTGRIWKITKAANGTGTGKPMTSSRTMGRTNGLDLSPDNKTLYVSESKVQGTAASVWAYRINGTALVADTDPLKEFTEGGDVDGLRVDTDGRIFVARPEVGQVVILVPPGAVGTAPPPVATQGKNPSNLTFGGADGRDVFVTQADPAKRFVERFRTDRPGREPCLQTPAPADCRAIAP
jgi:signal peptidase